MQGAQDSHSDFISYFEISIDLFEPIQYELGLLSALQFAAVLPWIAAFCIYGLAVIVIVPEA